MNLFGPGNQADHIHLYMFGTVALDISESSLAQSTWKFLIHMVVSRSSGKESNPSVFLLKSDLFHYSLLVGITIIGQPGKRCCECRIRYQFFRWNWNKDCFTAIRVDFIFLSFKVAQTAGLSSPPNLSICAPQLPFHFHSRFLFFVVLFFFCFFFYFIFF